MAKKPAVDEVAARQVGQGAVIWSGGQTEVVRNVTVVIHLANGMDMPLDPSATVEVLSQQPQPVTSDGEPKVGK